MRPAHCRRQCLEMQDTRGGHWDGLGCHRHVQARRSRQVTCPCPGPLATGPSWNGSRPGHSSPSSGFPAPQHKEERGGGQGVHGKLNKKSWSPRQTQGGARDQALQGFRGEDHPARPDVPGRRTQPQLVKSRGREDQLRQQARTLGTRRLGEHSACPATVGRTPRGTGDGGVDAGATELSGPRQGEP